MGDNHKRIVDVPEKSEKDKSESIIIPPPDSYLHDHCYEIDHNRDNCGNYDQRKRIAVPKIQKEEKSLKHKPKDRKSSDPSLSKKRKISTQNINETQHKDKGVVSLNSVFIFKCKLVQEYTNILEIIKEQNRNLERIKMQMLSTRARIDREGIEMGYCKEEDKLNQELVKAMVLQSKCSYEKIPEIPVASNILKESNSGCSEQDHAINERWSAGAENHFGNTNNSRTRPESNLCHTARDPVEGLFDKVDCMDTCLKESKKLNDQIINLLKKVKDHLKYCSQCGPSSENCKKLECICEELQFVCNQKLEQIINENKIHEPESVTPISRISAGQTSSIFNNSLSNTDQYSNFSKRSSCCCSTTPASSAIAESDLCCCKSKSESSEACCCSNQDSYSINTGKMLSIFECVAKELKDIKKKQDVKYCPRSEPDPSLMCEIQCLQKRLQMLECENAQLKCLQKGQKTQAEHTKKKYINTNQTVENNSPKIEENKKSKDDIANKIQDELDETKHDYEKKLLEYSNLLEEGSNKLEECLKEKEMLQKKLVVAEENLKNEQEKFVVRTSQVKKETDQLKGDIVAVREKSEEFEKKNNVQKQEIGKLKSELADVRAEAASVLNKLKERSERQMAEAYKKIRALEDDLARERASHCRAVKEKEKCYKELEYALCSAQNSQMKVKKLQACVKALMEQLNGRNQSATRCHVCADCNNNSN